MEDKKDLFEELETERLILRKVVDTDAEMLYKNIYNNFEYYKYYYQLPFKDFEEYKQLVEKYKEWYSNGNHLRWGIVLKENNELIGMIQLHTKDNLNNHCKIGWIIGYNYTNKGYTKEAAEKVIDFGLNTIKFHRIDAEIVEGNEESIKLAENLGMHYESTRKEDYKLGDNYYNQIVYTIINKE